MKPRNFKMTLGGSLILALIALATVVPSFIHFDPNLMNLDESLQSPSLKHLLGTDEFGRDLLAQLAYGARLSLGLSFTVVAIGCSVGLIIGSIAGFNGRNWDHVCMRVVDLFHAFPGFLVALTIVAFMGPSISHLILALSLTSWTGFARLVRGEILHLKQNEYIEAAHALGTPRLRILVLHIWPNLIHLLFIQCTFALAGVIISESGLSFLGLGVPADVPTWGSLLSSARRHLDQAPHLAIFAGLSLMFLVLGSNLLGEGLREYLDTRRGLMKI